MRFEVRRLHDEYRYTTVYVTHDQSEAMTTADVIAVMNAGKIEQAGSPEDIYDRPRSEFVARFIGSSNVVKGKALDENHIVVRGDAAALHRRQAARRGDDGAVSVRQHVIRLWAEQAAVDGERRCRRRGAAGLPRHQPRLHGRGGGRHAAARGHLAGREYRARARRSGCYLPPERCRVLERLSQRTADRSTSEFDRRCER